MTIRQGRILFDQRNLLNDEFASSKALQDWVGLSYDLRDEEVIPALNDALGEEWDTGIGNLPQRQYGWMFADEFVQVMNFDLNDKKDWLRLVRQGRTFYDRENLVNDEFTQSEQFSLWLENNN